MWHSTSRKPIRRPRLRRISLEALEDRCLLSGPGSLDSTFGSGGIVTTSLGARSSDYAFGVVVQSDGKIVAAGGSETSSGERYLDVVRYNPNGTLDVSFGSGGIVQTQFSDISVWYGGIVLQSDGKILVGNTVGGTFELVRYTASGTLDQTFNGSGTVSTHIGANTALLTGVALETVNGNAKIVAAGDASAGAGYNALALARYNLDGSLDTSFGNSGKVVTDLGHDADLYGVTIQADGQIVGAGTSSNTYLVARYGTSGNLDPTFASGGVATGSVSGSASAVIVQPDGKIVAGGEFFTNLQPAGWALERLNTDGSLDSMFSTGDVVDGPVLSSQGNQVRIRALAIDTSGNLVAAGTGASAGFTLARYHPDGSFDTTFGSGGLVTTTINGGGDSRAMTLQADGKIVVAGEAPAQKSGFSKIALARYLVAATPGPATPSAAMAQPAPGTGVVDIVLADGQPEDDWTWHLGRHRHGNGIVSKPRS
jgi:uncharacterized delta-60 repeat protein